MSEKLNEQLEITKLERKLDEGEASKFRGMTDKELEFELLQLAKHKEAIVTTRNEDQQLNSAKEVVKELNSPYVEQLKANKLKHRFIALLLAEKKL